MHRVQVVRVNLERLNAHAALGQDSHDVNTRDVFPTTLETPETTRTSVAGIVSPKEKDTLVLDPDGTEGNRRLLVADWGNDFRFQMKIASQNHDQFAD
jgi:hypothetical protein